MKIGFIQYNIKWENTPANLNYLDKLLERKDPKLDLLILPEMFNSGFTMNVEQCAESMNGQSIDWMKAVSLNFECAVCGSLIIEENGKFYNRFVWIDPEGRIEFYNKKHLFSLASEEDAFQKGVENNVFKYKDWSICPQICYDLRFPEWQRAALPFDLLIFVASWPERRIQAWRQLLQARAIENQCFVIGVNRIGEDGNSQRYNGASMIANPMGEIVLDAENNEGLFIHEIDHFTLTETRQNLPFLKDRDQITFD
jgi:omega-amidase